MCMGRSTVVVGGGEWWVAVEGSVGRVEWGARLQRRVSATGDTEPLTVVLSMGSGGYQGKVVAEGSDGGEVERGRRLRVGSARG